MRDDQLEDDDAPSKDSGDTARRDDVTTGDTMRHVNDAVDDGLAARFNITPKQEHAIVALLNQPTVALAATACDVGERTLHRWLSEPAFAQAYRSARREAFSHAVSMAQRYTPLAVQTLAKTMTDASSPHSSRVSAASNLLKFGRESIELDELVGRVEALEHKNAEREQMDEWKRR